MDHPNVHGFYLCLFFIILFVIKKKVVESSSWVDRNSSIVGWQEPEEFFILISGVVNYRRIRSGGLEVVKLRGESLKSLGMEAQVKKKFMRQLRCPYGVNTFFNQLWNSQSVTIFWPPVIESHASDSIPW